MTEQRRCEGMAARKLQCYMFEGGCSFDLDDYLELQEQQATQETTETPQTACSSSKLEAAVKIE